MTVNGSAELVAGVDVGGTKTLAVVVDVREPRRIVAQVRRATQGGGAAGVLATVTDALVQATAAAGASSAGLVAVGVGVPGIIDPATGMLSHAVNLGIGGDPVDLVGSLRRLVGDQVVVANDVDVAALGASELLGATGDVAYLSVGTGIAAGFVIRGEIHQGARGAAGEVGHLPVAPDGPVCECGQRGCLETVASGTAIAQRWAALGAGHDGAWTWPADDGEVRGSDGRSGGLPSVPVGDRDDSARRPDARGGVAADLFAAAAAGDAGAVALWDELCGHLATAVALVGQTVDPAHIVLGGGVADVGLPLRDGVRAALRRRAGASPLLSALALDQRVVLPPKDIPVGALGAAIAAHHLISPGTGRPASSDSAEVQPS